MVYTAELIRYGFTLLFGIGVSLLFANVTYTRKNRLAILIFSLILFTFQCFSLKCFGKQLTARLYPLMIHLPLAFFLTLYLKCPWHISVSSILEAYMCCQIPHWLAFMAGCFFKSPIDDYIFYIIFVLMVYYLLRKYAANSVQKLMASSRLSCLLFTSVPAFYYLFSYITTVYTKLLYSGAEGAVQAVPLMLSVVYFVFVILYYDETLKQAGALHERDLLMFQLQQTRTEFDALSQMQQSAAAYRHDMRHHLMLIRGLANEGNIQKIQEYISAVHNDINAMTPVRYCENDTVNLILSAFETRAKKEGVILIPDIILGDIPYVSDTELCSLFSNALENAINAAKAVTDKNQRKVCVRALIKSGKLIISIKNAYAGKLELDGELPKSQRRDVGHGFGLKSIISVIERHSGLYSIETEGGIFVLKLMIPPESKA